MEKYAGLAHKYGLEPTDAAAAAFEVMRMRSTRVAEDPWAVVTHAVELTLIYESRAEGLLCSTGQARKTAGLDYHDAQRFADRESDIADYHPAFHFHATLPRMLSPTLIEDQVIQVGEPREERLLAAMWVMKAFHGEQFPLQGVVCLIQQGTGHGHLGICEHRIPARLLLLHPAPHPRAIGWPRRGGDVVRKVAQALAQGKYA